MDSEKIKLTIAYDGTNYSGWQVQKTGVGVQQKLEEAFQKLFSSTVGLHGSSRTDTGVHALGLVAHVVLARSEFKMSLRKLPLALNAFLPEDIRVMSASRVPSEFHARFDATGKQYRYFAWNAPVMNPLLRFLAWHVPQHLDIGAMRSAAKMFLGTHDFKSFAATRGSNPPRTAEQLTVRTVSRCDIRRSGPLLTFVIEGDGFLYKMCRGMVGTLVEIGRGKFPISDLKRMLAARDRRASGMTAPAHGLVLWRVFYS